MTLTTINIPVFLRFLAVKFKSSEAAKIMFYQCPPQKKVLHALAHVKLD